MFCVLSLMVFWFIYDIPDNFAYSSKNLKRPGKKNAY